MGIFYQVLCTTIACYLCLMLGLMYAWPSPTVKLFKSANTPLNRPMTEIEISLQGSLASVSTMISFPISGYLNDKLGRKKSCILFASIPVVSWIIIIWCHKVEILLAAVFLSGFSGCNVLLVPIYVGEICQKSVRGAMTSCSIFFMSTGMLMSYILGALFQYSTMNYVYLSMMLLGVLMMNFMKESPMFLMKNGAENEAAKSVAFYRRVPVDSEEVHEELENMRKALNPDFEDIPPEEEKLQANGKLNKLSLYQFLKKSRSTRRALAVCLFLYTASVFQGLLVVQVFALPVFEEAAPDIPGNIVCVLLGVVCVAAGFIAAFLLDRLGRRPLMIYASFGTCICCLALGTQINLQWGSSWLTPAIIYVYCVTYLCGAGTVPYVILAEVFLPEVRSSVSVLAIEWGYICIFSIIFIFNPLITAIGLGSVFYLFAITSFISAIVSFFFLPETKGLTVDVIQIKFETQW